ncbi:MAG: hypothetical protein Fur0032_21200 [Terrimicrobiaceae bacterium]
MAEDFEGLFLVTFGIGHDLVMGELGAGGGASAGVADHGGEVANDEDGIVSGILELTEFVENDTVAEVNIWGGGIDTQLDAEGAAFGQFGGKFFTTDDALGARGQVICLFKEVRHMPDMVKKSGTVAQGI